MVIKTDNDPGLFSKRLNIEQNTARIEANFERYSTGNFDLSGQRGRKADCVPLRFHVISFLCVCGCLYMSCSFPYSISLVGA